MLTNSTAHINSFAVAHLVDGLPYKVADSIPDGVIGIFLSLNPSDCIAVDSASNRNEYRGKRRPVCRADYLTKFICRLSGNVGASTYWSPDGLSRTEMG